jgi:hypothetical protein
MRSVVLLCVFLGLSFLPAVAQHAGTNAKPRNSFNSGIKLRGNLHFSESATEARPQEEHGYGVGLEINGSHIGVALYGFTHGRTAEFDSEQSPVSVVLEANYFLPIERIRLAPYAGIHTGLGVFTKGYFDEPFLPKPRDSFRNLGYQFGVRLKPIPVIGLDAQWRRSSVSVAEGQHELLKRNQFMVGITLF